MNGLFKFLHHAVQKCCIKSSRTIVLWTGENRMSNEKRHISLFGVAGVLAATLLIAGLVFAGNIFQAQGKGMLTIRVMDKPVDLLTLDVEIDWVKIQAADESWIELTLKTDENKDTLSFDLLTLREGVSKMITEDPIPAGEYSMIQIHVLTASATYLDENSEEQNVDLNVPSDVIKVLLNPHMTIEADDEATVLIDLQPDQNSIAISQSLNLRPVIKAVVG